MTDVAQAPVLSSETRWAEKVAAQLRLVLATCADETRDNRQAYIADEISRQLEDVPPGKRVLYLDALEEKFPTWQHITAATDSAPPFPAAPETLDSLLQAFGRLAPKLTEAEKTKAQQHLEQMGVIEPVAQGGLGHHTNEIKQKLAMTANETIAPERLAKLCVQQNELLTKLDTLAWTTWRTIAPKTALKREAAQGDFRVQLRRYLRGDKELTDLQMADQIERTRRLVAALLGAIAQVSRGFVKKYQTRYSPEAINDIVKVSGKKGSWFNPEAAAAWQTYTELAGEITEASLQTDMQEVVVRYVEELMRGAPRAGN